MTVAMSRTETQRNSIFATDQQGRGKAGPWGSADPPKI